jgi:mono/diheme cytochrome c family protein
MQGCFEAEACMMLRGRLLIVIAAILAAAPSIAAARSQGEEIYRAACAACHGIDGRGAEVTAIALEIELPDLTDCSFSTREADADWIAVAHEGGPARAFAREMPAFGSALDLQQIRSALDYARTFCADRRWPRGELNLPRTLATEKAYPEDEVVLTTTANLGGAGLISNKLIYEKRIGPRSQLELIVPFGWREQERSGVRDPWSGGVGDVALGMKHVLHHSLRHGSIFSIAGEVKMPTGSERRGFGGGSTVLEPFVAYGQILPADAFIQIQAGAELPLKGSAPDEGFLRIAAGRKFTPRPFGRTWTPMLELLGSGRLDSTGSVHWDALPQIQVPLNRRQHVLACAGVRLPLNERVRSDPQLVVYLLWDWFDGGLTDGW